MTTHLSTHSELLSTAQAVEANGAIRDVDVSTSLRAIAEAFLRDWMRAWNKRDVPGLAALHTEDAVTINRYGTVLRGRKSAEEALSFLLGPHGPFGDTVFPPMTIVALREITSDVAIVQSSWSAPALGPDGKVVPGESNKMMLSYTLVRRKGRWMTTQIDAHNVEPMDLPFSSGDQKKK